MDEMIKEIKRYYKLADENREADNNRTANYYENKAKELQKEYDLKLELEENKHAKKRLKQIMKFIVDKGLKNELEKYLDRCDSEKVSDKE